MVVYLTVDLLFCILEWSGVEMAEKKFDCNQPLSSNATNAVAVILLSNPASIILTARDLFVVLLFHSSQFLCHFSQFSLQQMANAFVLLIWQFVAGLISNHCYFVVRTLTRTVQSRTAWRWIERENSSSFVMFELILFCAEPARSKNSRG